MTPSHLESIIAFLKEIGVPVREEELSGETFLPGIRISAGTLVYDRTRLKWPGDLLHEAGHLAVTPANRRHALDDRLSAEQEAADAGETEAIAWSFAAAIHLALPLAQLFHHEGYRRYAQQLIFSFSLGVYPGSAGLARAGLAALGRDATARGVRPYPYMLRWLRE
jgi:hypothetical protein